MTLSLRTAGGTPPAARGASTRGELPALRGVGVRGDEGKLVDVNSLPTSSSTLVIASVAMSRSASAVSAALRGVTDGERARAEAASASSVSPALREFDLCLPFLPPFRMGSMLRPGSELGVLGESGADPELEAEPEPCANLLLASWRRERKNLGDGVGERKGPSRVRRGDDVLSVGDT